MSSIRTLKATIQKLHEIKTKYTQELASKHELIEILAQEILQLSLELQAKVKETQRSVEIKDSIGE